MKEYKRPDRGQSPRRAGKDETDLIVVADTGEIVGAIYQNDIVRCGGLAGLLVRQARDIPLFAVEAGFDRQNHLAMLAEMLALYRGRYALVGLAGLVRRGQEQEAPYRGMMSMVIAVMSAHWRIGRLVSRLANTAPPANSRIAAVKISRYATTSLMMFLSRTHDTRDTPYTIIISY